MNFCVARIAAAAAALLALTSAALAHTGVGHASGFAHGFVHPLGGIDHVSVMVAAGLYAVLLGGSALWLVPVTFVAVMALGGALGAAGIGLPFVETGIALSVVVLGLAVALHISLPTLAAMALVGLFAIFHGHAHGAEMPPDAAGYVYAAGFMLATALLHGTGIAIGMVAGKFSNRGGWRVVQACGGAMTAAGMALLVHAV